MRATTKILDIASDIRITIGLVLRPRGLRGEVVILPFTDHLDRFQAGTTLRGADTANRECHFTITRSRVEKNVIIASFDEIVDRTAAEEIRGVEFTIASEEVRNLPAGRYYPFDLIGLTVRNDHDDMVGTVRDVIIGGPQDYLVIEREQHHYLIPMVEAFIQSINPEQGVVLIHEIDGMWIPYS